MSGVFRLERTGNTQLRFEGHLLTEHCGQHHLGKTHARWHNLSLYQTSGGQMVAHIQYNSTWEGETSYATAELIPDVTEAIKFFRTYNPFQHLVGYPQGISDYDRKQERLKQDLGARYEAQVTEILKLDQFAEKIE